MASVLMPIKEKIFLLYEDGHSCREIKNELELLVTVRSIQRFIRKHGKIRTVGDAFRLAVSRGQVNWDHLKKDKKASEYRKSIGDKMRFTVLKRDGFKCVLCGLSAVDGISLQLDHIIRPEDGGTNAVDNLRTLCIACNSGSYHSERAA